MAETPFRFAFRRRVRYAEVDAQAVVYFARHLEWADVGVVEYWRAAGLYEQSAVAGGETEFHVKRAEIDYLAPMRLDEEIDIRVRTSRIGRSSIEMIAELHGAGAGAGGEDLRARIRLVQVHVDAPGGRPSPVPGWIVARLETLEGRALASEGARA